MVKSKTGFLGIKYKCSRDCLATVQKELDPDTKSEIALSLNVHCELKDTLKAERLFFIANTKKHINCFKVKMMSGRHECSAGTPNCRVYAEIDRPFAQILNAIEKNNILKIK